MFREPSDEPNNLWCCHLLTKIEQKIQNDIYEYRKKENRLYLLKRRNEKKKVNLT